MFSVLTSFLLAFQFFVTGASTSGKPPVDRHPFYVSVTEVNQNSNEKSLEISCKFFADDFEHTLEKAYNTKLDVTAEKEKAMLNKYIADYVTRHLRLSADGNPVAIKYVGFEKEGEAVFAYFEVTNITAVKRLEAANNLLYDFTNEQINIMHVTVGGKRQSTKLTYPETKASFTF